MDVTTTYVTNALRIYYKCHWFGFALFKLELQFLSRLQYRMLQVIPIPKGNYRAVVDSEAD